MLQVRKALQAYSKERADGDEKDLFTPLDQVATLLGHESLDTTRICTHPSERDLERAIHRVEGENPE